MGKKTVKWIPIGMILEHEEIESRRLKVLEEEIRNNWRVVPIIVTDSDRQDKYVVLDGHHRLNALIALDVKKIPCIVVDYKEIELKHWREEYSHITKEDVIRTALAGKKLPNKTTRHILDFFPEEYTVSLPAPKNPS